MSAEVESEIAASEEGAAAFQRVLLKLSGEALLGSQEYGIDLDRVEAIAREIRDVHELGVETAIVLGAGNIYRGMEVAAEGIRVNLVSPGPISTDMNNEQSAPDRVREIPMGRFGKPEEVASAVLFLASNEASFVSSASLMISGAR